MRNFAVTLAFVTICSLAHAHGIDGPEGHEHKSKPEPSYPAWTEPTQQYFAYVFEDPNKGGRWLALGVTADGRSGVPTDEFQKYYLQDKITEIYYCLPVGTELHLFTDRFFKNSKRITDWEFGITIHEKGTVTPDAPKVKIAEDKTLILPGIGKPETVNLSTSYPKYDNNIGSEKIITK